MVCSPIPNAQQAAPQARKIPRVDMILGLVLLSIMVRSFLGFLVSFSWEIQPTALIVMTLVIILGKAMGGILADRWGWIRVGVGSMLAAIPFLMYGSSHPLAAIPGLFLLNIAMPITLVATVRTLPDFPGFAFGLTCLAILLGAMPTLLGCAIHEFWIVGLVLLLAAVGLFRGLQLLLQSTLCREELFP
jgi:FSR family fosmidomycin resistance protein-like MFS transporter